MQWLAEVTYRAKYVMWLIHFNLALKSRLHRLTVTALLLNTNFVVRHLENNKFAARTRSNVIRTGVKVD